MLVAGLSCNSGEGPVGSPASRRNDLSAMERTTVAIRGHKFDVWVARTPQQHQYGLMQVKAEEMAPTPEGLERGMLFVFEDEERRSFWMANTILPLDIAFLRSDGQIVKTHTMAPLETRQYSSVLPARFALEVNAGVFSRLGIAAGDVAQIPDSVLKPGQPRSE